MNIVSKSGGNEFQGDAKAIGMDTEDGSFEVCKKADVTTVDLNNPYLTPTRDPITSFVRYGSSRDTDNVLVDGRF